MLYARPGVRITDDGRAEVALLVETDPDKRAFALVRVTFARGGDRFTPEVKELGTLPRPVWSAGASFVMSPGPHDRIDWAILLEGGEIVSSFSPGSAVDPGAPLAFPLEILSLAKAAYVLVQHPTDGPRFFLLR